HRAKVKSLFWGTGFDPDLKPHVRRFFQKFGRSREYETITQYSDTSGPVQKTSLSGSQKVDPRMPPSGVSDQDEEDEIIGNLLIGKVGRPKEDTIYYRFMRNGVTSTLGGASSCVDYCAYHSYFYLGGQAIKYAVVPYPSCWGCQGYTQNGLSTA